MKTISEKTADVERKWYVVDLNARVVGRVATRIATILRGKHKPDFTPHVDTGDFVIAINADKIRFTGAKLQDKYYRRYSGYPGGLTEISAGDLLEKTPEDVIRFAVRGMLPKNTLGRQLLRKLKVYAGPDHPHAAQNPEVLELG